MKEIMRREEERREKGSEMKLEENRWRRGKMESRWKRWDETREGERGGDEKEGKWVNEEGKRNCGVSQSDAMRRRRKWEGGDLEKKMMRKERKKTKKGKRKE